MNTRLGLLIITITVFATATSTTRLDAQGQKTKRHHYQLIDVGTFGGPSSWMSNPAVVRFGFVTRNAPIDTKHADCSHSTEKKRASFTLDRNTRW